MNWTIQSRGKIKEISILYIKFDRTILTNEGKHSLYDLFCLEFDSSDSESDPLDTSDSEARGNFYQVTHHPYFEPIS